MPLQIRPEGKQWRSVPAGCLSLVLPDSGDNSRGIFVAVKALLVTMMHWYACPVALAIDGLSGF